jgi:hypothetical protein
VAFEEQGLQVVWHVFAAIAKRDLVIKLAVPLIPLASNIYNLAFAATGALYC